MWSDSDGYEAYVGRWSREIARRFLPWIEAGAGLRWLDVGCGTGALSSQVVDLCQPVRVAGVDPSPGYLSAACRLPIDVAVGDARQLPFAGDSFDCLVSGLVLNFVPEPERAIAEMRRVVREGGTIAVYVWDYSEGMELLRRFWQAAAETDPGAAELDEGARFAICRPDVLRQTLETGGLASVVVEAVEVTARFASFEDYWRPFLTAQGPASAYLGTLDDAARERLRARLEASLPTAAGGSLELLARAWAARGIN